MERATPFLEMLRCKGLDLDETHAATGVARETIRLLTLGRVLPTLKTTMKLSKCMGLPVGVLAQVFADQYEHRAA